MHRFVLIAAAGWVLSVIAQSTPAPAPAAAHRQGRAGGLFATSHSCMACHNGMIAPSGEDVSIGVAWRATMMANSSRDPYWQASVRRETIDHPKAAADIESECATCHMPMSHTAARAAGALPRVFAHLNATDPLSRLALDGVSCTLCHQITPENFGSPASFTGGFAIDTTTPLERRLLFGPFAPEPSLQQVMHSATGFQQTEGLHVRQSELCATCHTLYTTARDARGEAIGRFPEQVPFQEWQHSRYKGLASCQACHMPPVAGAAPIASVLAPPRTGTRLHSFVGGNFLVLRMLERFRAELGVEAPSAELERAASATVEHLAEAAARLTIERAAVAGGRLTFDVAIENLSGHKLPTAYPSRRVWLKVLVRDAAGRVLFSSGAVSAAGAIAGNANDETPGTFEPHYRQISRQDQVQIYEPILADAAGAVTTGLIKAVRYAKDNRLLPHGFDKATAHADVAVHGEALDDGDFSGGGDRVEYLVDVGAAAGPLTAEVELLYQPIAFRWADNLRHYDAREPARFVKYYDAMSGGTAAVLARASVTVGR